MYTSLREWNAVIACHVVPSDSAKYIVQVRKDYLVPSTGPFPSTRQLYVHTHCMYGTCLAENAESLLLLSLNFSFNKCASLSFLTFDCFLDLAD